MLQEGWLVIEELLTVGGQLQQEVAVSMEGSEYFIARELAYQWVL